mgnify:CR=1 FL=1|jgi:hypothetical protein
MILVVKNCKECPFCTIIPGERPKCNVATIKYREIETENEPPVWCPLRKEQVIVRSFE